MISNCSKWSLSSFLLALALGSAFAQPPAPTPAPSPTPVPKIKDGFIRFWNMLPKEAGELLLQYDAGGQANTVAAAEPGNFSAGYIPVKPARYNLKVVRTDDPKTVLKTFDVVMRANVYVSFLAQAKDGALSIEMLDDTYDRKSATTGKLTVRHFLPGAKVTIAPAGAKPAGPLTDGAVEVFDALPAQPVLVKMKALLPDGSNRDWAMEVNLRDCRHASIILALDPYGRFRPRLSPDGQPDFSDPEALPTVP